MSAIANALRTTLASASRTPRTFPLRTAFAARPTPTNITHSRTMSSASAQFLEAIKKRRTYYSISNTSPIPNARVEEIVREIVLHVPSSFNSQSSRVVVLFKKEHEALWDIVLDVLRPVVPAAQFGATEAKIKSFKAGYGSVLFFEDQEPVRTLQEKFPLYQESFPVWAEHTSGMIQFATWTALELEGFGASLQHYNPLIDQKVKAQWDIPSTWNLVAEMPFGTPSAAPGDKAFAPIEERVKVFGK